MDNARIDRARKLRSVIYPSTPGYPPPQPLAERPAELRATMALSVAIAVLVMLGLAVELLSIAYDGVRPQVQAVSDDGGGRVP